MLYHGHLLFMWKNINNKKKKIKEKEKFYKKKERDLTLSRSRSCDYKERVFPRMAGRIPTLSTQRIPPATKFPQ